MCEYKRKTNEMVKHKNIRSAEKQDINHIKRIAEETELFPSEMLDEMISGYFDSSKADIWFVYVDAGEAISFGFCEPERMTEGTWNLLAIGVDPKHQGTGIGAEMMAYLEKQLRDRGERVLLVETMGIPEFERTRRFYRNVGYTEEARIREFYEEGADKVIFWKHL